MNRRTAKLARAVREVVSTAILFELRDPRIKEVTVTGAEVAPDVRTAKVYVSVRGSEKEAALTLHGLNAARGYLQRKIADRIQTRNTPVLTFKIDRSVQQSLEVARQLAATAAERAAPDAPAADPEPADPEPGTPEPPPSGTT